MATPSDPQDDQPTEPPPSVVAWITRDKVTLKHIRGLLEGLEAHNVLDYASISVIALEENSVVTTPWGEYYTWLNLPPEGVIYVSNTG